jgi:hypothetical protein
MKNQPISKCQIVKKIHIITKIRTGFETNPLYNLRVYSRFRSLTFKNAKILNFPFLNASLHFQVKFLAVHVWPSFANVAL